MWGFQYRGRAHRRGQAATIFALTLPSLMGLAAFGLDFGLVTSARFQAQAVADAAALAATEAIDDRTQGMVIAQAYADRMSLNGVTMTVDDVVFGYWDSEAETFVPAGNDANAVKVEVSAEVPMHLARIFDLETVRVSAEAGAGAKVVPNRAPDTVLVLDTTLSMSQSEIRAERDAAEALLECVKRNSAPESRVAMVLFGGVDSVVMDMSEYGDDWRQIERSVDEIQRCRNWGPWNPCSHTNPASGYEAALDILENADTPEDVGQAIVLMSDGMPTVNNVICGNRFRRWDNRGYFRFPLSQRCAETNWRIESSDLRDWTLGARAKAVERGVDVYTTYYGTNLVGSTWLKDHVMANNGTHHRALRREDIDDAFVDICVQFTGSSAGMVF